jgi:hypothetical protein
VPVPRASRHEARQSRRGAGASNHDPSALLKIGARIRITVLKVRLSLTLREKNGLARSMRTVRTLAGNTLAQHPASDERWDKLSHLAPGSEIRVVLAGGKTLHGFLQKVTSDSLAINATTSQETLSRAEIKRVQLKRKGHRGRNALIGLLIGTGGGLAIGAGADRSASGSWFPDAGKAILTPLGALVGTVVGVAIPTGGWREIYRAP